MPRKVASSKSEDGLILSPEDRAATESEPEAPEPLSEEAVPIVAIGASAGGLEAITQFFAEVPQTTGVAFVVVQHLDPAVATSLPSILEHKRPIVAVEVTEGMAVEGSHIYVAPSDSLLAIVAGKFRLTPRQPQEPHPLAIDYCFEALAIHNGSLAVAVLLSGTGSDGTVGLKAIKDAGGITFAQDHESAKFPQMPDNARAAGVVDFSLPPGEIATEVLKICQQPYLAEPAHAGGNAEDALAFAEICKLLTGISGVELGLYKPATLHRRIERRRAIHKQKNLVDYAAILRSNRAELEALKEDVFIHVSRFFRDEESLLALRKLVFEQMVNRKNQGDSIRIWSVGCANGEEVYSLAMLLLEELGEGASNLQIKIVGTDVSAAAIRRARAGIYPEASMVDISPARRERFFHPVERGYQIVKAVRNLCLFAVHDVTKEPPFSKLDLISCRNVLIYLGPILQTKVVEAFHYGLNPNGILFLGRSESLSGYPRLFTALDSKERIFRRNDFRLPVHSNWPVAGRFAAPGVLADTAVPTSTSDLRKEVDRQLLERFAPSAIVVSQDLTIALFHGKTSMFLAPSAGEPSFHLLRMLREELVPAVHQGIKKVLRTGKPEFIDSVDLVVDGSAQAFDIDLTLLPNPDKKNQKVLVLFRPSPLQPKDGEAREKTQAGVTRIAKLERELSWVRQELTTAIGEHESITAEMRIVHEDALSVNEELQATNEELETAKEELQATNEELVRFNEEIQARNIELAQLTGDLNNLLTGIDIPIVILNHELTIRRFTPQAGRLFNLIASDVGRPFNHLASTLGPPNWDALMSEVTGNRRPVQQEVQDRNGHWYSLRVSPHLPDGGGPSGLLIALFDINAVKATLAEANRARDLAQVAVRAKSDFLSAMSHEIRTPMNGIIGMTDLILDTPLNQEQLSMAEGIKHSADGLLEIINDILDFSKGEAQKLELELVSFDLRSTLEEVVSLLSLRVTDRPIELALWYPPEAPSWFVSDPGRIRQIVTNLLANAVKFTKAGYVLLEVSCIERNTNLVDVQISIHDSGIGINADKQHLLFQKFSQVDSSTTREFGGTGLGLAICKQLTERMGGKISVNSIPGEGSSFWVQLPLPIAREQSAAIPTLGLDKIRCLVADRHSISRFVLVEQCRHWGMTVKEVDSLGACLPELQRALESGNGYELIIADYPEHEQEAEEWLRQLRLAVGASQVRVIFLKSLTQKAAPKHPLAGELESFLLKPVRPNALADSLQRIFLGKPAAGDHIADESKTSQRQLLPGLRVLVAEDNLVNQRVTSGLLKKLGCIPTVASNGIEAVREAVEGAFDIILMDCQMPEMDGFEATQKILAQRNKARWVPIIALSAGVLEENKERCRQAGMDGFLAKPIDLQGLQETLSRWGNARLAPDARPIE